MTDIDTAVT